MSEFIDDESAAAENALKKKILGLSVVLIVVALAVTYILTMPAYYQNYAPEQPIPFSHKLHAGDYQIPCLYCHGSAEHAQFAAVPGAETCMNCHSVVKPESPWMKMIKESYDSGKPVAWVKVHVLPDFVFFNHSRHVAAGVQCQTCHGPVETMEKVFQYERLTMGWCVECHRNDDYITQSRRDWVDARAKLQGREPGTPLLTQVLGHPELHNADVSCSTCHR